MAVVPRLKVLTLLLVGVVGGEAAEAGDKPSSASPASVILVEDRFTQVSAKEQGRFERARQARLKSHREAGQKAAFHPLPQRFLSPRWAERDSREAPPSSPDE